MTPSFFEWYIAANALALLAILVVSFCSVAALITALFLSDEAPESNAGLVKCGWVLETSYALLPALGALGTIWRLWSATSTRIQWEAANRNLAAVLQQALFPLAVAVVVMLIAGAGHALVRYRLLSLERVAS